MKSVAMMKNRSRILRFCHEHSHTVNTHVLGLHIYKMISYWTSVQCQSQIFWYRGNMNMLTPVIILSWVNRPTATFLVSTSFCHHRLLEVDPRKLKTKSKKEDWRDDKVERHQLGKPEICNCSWPNNLKIILTFGLQNFLHLNRSSRIRTVRTARCHVIFCLTKTVCFIPRANWKLQRNESYEIRLRNLQNSEKRRKRYIGIDYIGEWKRKQSFFFTLVRCETETPCKDPKHLKRWDF